MRVFGGETFGGGKYLAIIAAIVGFFALSARSVARGKGLLFSSIFLLVGLLSMAGNLIFLAGPKAYWLFLLFPARYAMQMSAAESAAGAGGIMRFGGVAAAAGSVCMYLLCRYGIKTIFSLARPRLLISFIVMLGLSFLGGFRSTFLFFVALIAVMFFIEKAYRSAALPVGIGLAVVALAILIPIADRLPASVQRVLTIIPGTNVATAVQVDADYSVQWRLDLWRALMPIVPRYFWIGKGLGMDPSDYYLIHEAERRGFASPYEWAMISGDYHNGGLTLLIPFGIFGLLGFVWFATAALRLLYRNYRQGDPELRRVNGFFLAFMISKIAFYFLVYGQFYSDFYYYTGIAGFSVALNAEWYRARSKSRTQPSQPAKTRVLVDPGAISIPV